MCIRPPSDVDLSVPLVFEAFFGEAPVTTQGARGGPQAVSGGKAGQPGSTQKNTRFLHEEFVAGALHALGQ